MNTKNHLSLTPWGWLLGLLSIAAIATAALPGCAFFQGVKQDVYATSLAFLSNPKGYLESVAVQAQHANTKASDIVDTLDSLLEAAGLAPANSEQQKALDALKAQLKSVQGRVDAVNAILAPGHLDAIVNPPVTWMKMKPNRDLRPPHGSVKVASAYDLREVR